jgi:hypothetical protein
MPEMQRAGIESQARLFCAKRFAALIPPTIARTVSSFIIEIDAS